MKKETPKRLAFNAFSCAVYFLLGAYFTVNQTLADRISGQYGQGSAAMGLMVGLLFFGMVTSALVMGEISERTGKKFVITLGLAGIAAGVVIVALSQSFVVACIGTFVSGTGFGTTESMIGSATADANAPNPTKALNITQAIFSAGAVASPLLIGSYLKAGGAWETVYFAVAAVALVLLALSSRLSYGAHPEKGDRAQGVVTLTLFKKPVFVLYLVLIMVYVGSESGVGFWVVRYFNEIAANPALGELSLSVFWLGTLVSRLAVTRMKNHRLLVVLSFAVTALGTVLFLYMPSPALKIAAFALAALGMGPVWPTLFSLGSLQHAKHSGAAFGVMMVASSLGGTLIQPAIGKIVEGAPVSSAYWLIAGLCMAMSLLMLISMRIEKKKQQLNELSL